MSLYQTHSRKHCFVACHTVEASAGAASTSPQLVGVRVRSTLYVHILWYIP